VTALSLVALALLWQAAPAPASTPAPTPAPQALPEIAAEVERGVRAYNTQDLAYYQGSLLPDAVYIADDGATFAGKERVIGLFTRIFARTPKPQLAVTNIITGGRGDVAWARFDWTLSGIEKARPGVAIALFVKGASGWQVASIQNTAKGHAMRAASPSPGASPAASHH
jgi:ketosteroid isomerase-like protein